MTPLSAPRRGLRWTLSVERHRLGDILVFALHGRLSSATSATLTEAVVDAISAGESRIVVDFVDLDYVSSAGLIALDALSGRMAVSGGALVLCGLTDPVRLVFELAGLLPNFTVVAARTEAVERVRQVPSA